MSLLVALIGILMLVIGVAVLISPATLKQTLRVFLDRKWMPLASIVRIVMGIVCVFGAAETRLPTLVFALGILLIIAGLSIPFIGFERIERFAGFWLDQSSSVIRLWALAAMAFGGVLTWAAI